MFPLGSVLFPYMPLPLRVFEERYLVMLSKILQDEPSEFGVVLIERGQEVGGGEQRFAVGTVAQVTELEAAEGFIGLLAQGERRFEVLEWLEEDPYPHARIRELEPLEWTDDLEPLRERAERDVRRFLALASEFSDQQWSASVELSTSPIASSWQLAGIAPISEIDQVNLLRSTSVKELLESVIDLTAGAEASFRASWPEEPDGDFEEEL